MKGRAYRGRDRRTPFYVCALRYTPIMFISVTLAIIFMIASVVVRWFAR